MATAPSDPSATPDDELDPDEPRTPLSLTLLGFGLFLLAALFFVTQTPTDPSPMDAPAEESDNEGAAADNAQDPAAAPPRDPHEGHGH